MSAEPRRYPYPRVPCERCGTEQDGLLTGPNEWVASVSCPSCPPVVCTACGEDNNRECSCWEEATQADLDELTCAAMEPDVSS